jgi:hypothetical protein
MARQNQIFAQRLVGIHSIGLGDERHIASVRKLQLDVRERLNVTGFTGSDLARSFGEGARFPKLTRIQSHHAIGFAIIHMAQHDRFHAKGSEFCFRHEDSIQVNMETGRHVCTCLPVYVSTDFLNVRA